MGPGAASRRLPEGLGLGFRVRDEEVRRFTPTIVTPTTVILVIACAPLDRTRPGQTLTTSR